MAFTIDYKEKAEKGQLFNAYNCLVAKRWVLEERAFLMAPKAPAPVKT